MKVKEAFAMEDWDNVSKDVFDEIHYHFTIINVSELVLKHGKDTIISDINKCLALKTIKED